MGEADEGIQALYTQTLQNHFILSANGQYILQALAPATQGQMVNLQQQQPTIIQAQPGQIPQVQVSQQLKWYSLCKQ